MAAMGVGEQQAVMKDRLEYSGDELEHTFDEDDPEIDKVIANARSSSMSGSASIIYKAKHKFLLGFEAVLLVGITVYVFATDLAVTSSEASSAPKLSQEGVDCTAAAGGHPGSCYSLRGELLGSMDLSGDPCDDFYEYACGLWAESHPGYKDQLHYLQVRAQDMTAEVMKRTAPAVISRPQETLTSTEQLSLAYMQCTDVYLYQADFSAVAEGLLFERLALFNESVTAAMGLSSAVMDTLVTLGAKWNVPLFFRMDPTPDPKVYKRTVLVADYSPRLVHWMNHKKRILASATSARIFREYFKIRPTTSSNPEVATTALLKLDETTTVHWVSTLLSLKGRHRRYFRLKHLARRSADWKRWLQVIGRTLGPHTGGEVIAEEHLFPAVDDAVSSHEATPSTLRDFVALHVLLQLAPFTSPRLVDALLNDPSREAATTYVANECASAVSRLASGPLTNIVFRGPAGRERQRRALNHLERLGNQTASFLLAANKKRSERGEKMLPSFNLSVVWQTGLDDSLGGNATDLKLRDLDGPFINLYLNSVEALTSSRLQTRPLASLRFTRGAYKGASGGLLSLRNSLADAPTALYESVFVPTTALLEPFLVTDSDSLTLGTLGNFLSRGLWRLILDSAAGSATRDQLLAGVINLCPDDKTARRRDGESSRAAGDLFAAHLPGIAGLQTAYAVHSRGANVSADDSAEFSSAQLFYIGSCFQLCAAPASGDGAAGEDQGRGRGWSGGHVSARSLCNVPLMLSEGFGAAFGCTNVSKMMRLATRSGGCIDPGAWPPRRRIIHA